MKSDRKVVIVVGALFDLIGAGAFVGLAVVIFPILRRHKERLALGYVVARSFEAVPFIIANISLLSILTLSQVFVQASTADVPNLAAIPAAFTYAFLRRCFAVSSSNILREHTLFSGSLMIRNRRIYSHQTRGTYEKNGNGPDFAFVGVRTDFRAEHTADRVYIPG